MTSTEDGWLRRLVGGRRQDSAGGETEPETATSLPPATEEAEAHLQIARAKGAQLARVNKRQLERIAQLEAMTQQASAEHTAQIAALQEELRRTQEQQRLFQTQVTGEQAARQTAQTQLGHANAAATELTHRLDAARRTLLSLQAQVSRDSKKRATLKARLAESETELKQAQAGLKQTQADTRAMQEHHRHTLEHIFGSAGADIVGALVDSKPTPKKP